MIKFIKAIVVGYIVLEIINSLIGKDED